jgi:hypothetical protein
MGKAALSHALFFRGSRLAELERGSSLSLSTLARARAKLDELKKAALASEGAG